jgi:hypothetical protein
VLSSNTNKKRGTCEYVDIESMTTWLCLTITLQNVEDASMPILSKSVRVSFSLLSGTIGDYACKAD